MGEVTARPWCPIARCECRGRECALAVRAPGGYKCALSTDTAEVAFTTRYVDARDDDGDDVGGAYG